MNIKVLRVNAFTESIKGGNTAGVVLDAPDLIDEQMKQISKKLHVSESAFVYPSSIADFKVRFFSPTVEVDLCGHATIAAFFTLALKGKLPRNKNRVTQETNVGVLPVTIYYDDDNTIDRVMMNQNKNIYKNIHFDISFIADSLNIDKKDIDDSLPRQIVSTGLFTLPICVKSFDDLKHMTPDFKKVQKICEQIGAGSIHVFTFETIEPGSLYHARNFAPLYGINEDPVTGTANGAVSSYVMKHKKIKENNFICEQGDIIGRPGRVFVEIHNDEIKVGGKARITQETELEI
jgi:PhzF family phenazine biosynthesis protein